MLLSLITVPTRNASGLFAFCQLIPVSCVACRTPARMPMQSSKRRKISKTKQRRSTTFAVSCAIITGAPLLLLRVAHPCLQKLGGCNSLSSSACCYLHGLGSVELTLINRLLSCRSFMFFHLGFIVQSGLTCMCAAVGNYSLGF